MSKFEIARRYSHVTENLWSTYKVLSDKYAKVNLGQGAPDYNPPEPVVSALKSVLDNAAASQSASSASHQYAPLAGHRDLISVLAKLYSRILNRSIDPKDGSVSIGIGAQGCLFNAFTALVNPGDEVIIIEPYYDCYPSMVLAAGGVPVFVPLRPTAQGNMANDWKLDPAELAAAFGPRTKLLVLNTPNNPLGKVWDKSELTQLAELCQKYDVVCLSDDVYEWMVYDGELERMANVPGMWDRTLTIGSAGKCFNITGWRIGWCVGPPSLVGHVTKVQAEVIYSVPSPLQAAVAAVFESELLDSLASSRAAEATRCLAELRARMRDNQRLICSGLAAIGLRCVVPSGGCFVLVEVRDLPKPEAEAASTTTCDVAVVNHLMKQYGLGTIPCSPFFSPGHRELGSGYLRVCVNKKVETLERGLELFKMAVRDERDRRGEMGGD